MVNDITIVDNTVTGQVSADEFVRACMAQVTIEMIITT